jgi:hypothetical protein
VVVAVGASDAFDDAELAETGEFRINLVRIWINARLALGCSIAPPLIRPSDRTKSSATLR